MDGFWQVETCLRCGYMASNDLCVCPPYNRGWSWQDRKHVHCSKDSKLVWIDLHWYVYLLPSSLWIVISSLWILMLIYSVKPRRRPPPLQLVRGQYRNSSVIRRTQSRGSKSQWRQLRFSPVWACVVDRLSCCIHICIYTIPYHALKSMTRGSTWIPARGIAGVIDRVIRFQRSVNLPLPISSSSTSKSKKI